MQIIKLACMLAKLMRKQVMFCKCKYLFELSMSPQFVEG